MSDDKDNEDNKNNKDIITHHTIEQRKQEHINFCLEHNVSFNHNYFDDIDVIYQALPELDRETISVSTSFLDRTFRFPLLINSMTGGCLGAEKINIALAQAAEQFNIPFAVGSQRAMIENPALTSTYNVKKYAPSLFLIGNIGITHVNQSYFSKIDAALKNIDANALVVHLNAAQEAVQKEGTTDFRNKAGLLDDLCRFLDVPVYVKEVGHGISKETARLLAQTSIKALDVAGKSGTSWTKVEHLRNNDPSSLFSEIGIPTPISIILAKKHFPLAIVSSGGIRHSLDMVKSLILGASICGISLPILKIYQEQGSQGLHSFLHQQEQDLKTAYFLLGAGSTSALSSQKLVFLNSLASWYSAALCDTDQKNKL
ncbi:type 2 isopentenyl-diphosphate Delta-isomerase [Candidatus Woesearchaeota archaeon]|nr:type 2 isopentenyl-diphosphate Delta-isomerase [Candidatus Woesearchaeota archaeon]